MKIDKQKLIGLVIVSLLTGFALAVLFWSAPEGQFIPGG